MTPQLLLIRGLPGSGKTTMALALMHVGEYDVHLEADMFHMKRCVTWARPPTYSTTFTGAWPWSMELCAWWRLQSGPMTRYLQALQRESDKRWDFTSSTGSSGAYPLGYCAGWKEPPEGDEAAQLDARLGEGFSKRLAGDIEKKRPFQAKFHRDGHATEAEACACYRQYELDLELEFHDLPRAKADTLHRCEAPECEEFTAGIGQLGQHRFFHLCPAHQNRATVEQIIAKKDDQ